MPRTPVGKVNKDVSRTALYAYIAARLHGVRTADQDRFFREGLRVLVGQKSAARAATRTRGSSRSTEGGERTATRRARRKPPFRDWVLVDENRLGFELAVVRFPGQGGRQKELVKALKKVVGVRQIIETEESGDVLAILIFAGLEQRRDLRARLEELSERFFWENVLSETHEPALVTWQELARTAADAEGLLP